MKATWNVLNKAMRPNSKKNILPSYFTENDVVHNDSKTIANEFNLFFANIGASIVNCIVHRNKTKTFKWEAE